MAAAAKMWNNVQNSGCTVAIGGGASTRLLVALAGPGPGPVGATGIGMLQQQRRGLFHIPLGMGAMALLKMLVCTPIPFFGNTMQ